MKSPKAILFILFLSFATKFTAQTTNAEKIIGCWTFKKIEFNGEYDFAKNLVEQAKDSKLCFNTEGKFTNIKGAITKNGTYQITKDGKILTHKTTSNDKIETGSSEINVNAEILIINETSLALKIEIGIMYFDKI